MKRVQQSFCYLADHLLCALFWKLHQAVLNDIEDQRFYVSSNALFIRELLYSLLNEVWLRIYEVSDVLYRIRI